MLYFLYKFMKKIFKNVLLIIIVIFTIYILLIFTSPVLAKKIESFFWLNWFNDFIIDFKNTLDSTATNIPTKDEFKGTYNNALSGALQIKWDAIIWIETIKDWVDNVRWTLNTTVEKIEEVKTSVNETKAQIENTVDVIKQTWNTISDLTNSFSWDNGEIDNWDLNNN